MRKPGLNSTLQPPYFTLRVRPLLPHLSTSIAWFGCGELPTPQLFAPICHAVGRDVVVRAESV